MVPEVHHQVIQDVLRSVVDLDAVEAVAPMTGGASGALVYRLRVAARHHVLRVETARDPLRDPHRTYPCMRIAADACVAPPLQVADADAGIVLMDLVHQRPLSEHPAGTVGVLREVGQLIARLQRAPVAPAFLELPALLDVMLGMLETSDVYAPGLLEPIRAGFIEVVAAYPWSRSAPVTSHNDVNPFNVLYDGERLWLIDWELAFRNDPFADVAGAVNNLGDGADVDDAVLAAWAGAEPDPAMAARLTLMRAAERAVLRLHGHEHVHRHGTTADVARRTDTGAVPCRCRRRRTAARLDGGSARPRTHAPRRLRHRRRVGDGRSCRRGHRRRLTMPVTSTTVTPPSSADLPDDLVTVDVAAGRLQVHPKTVLRFIHDGRLRATRIGKAYRIQRRDLDTFAGVQPTANVVRRPAARVMSVVDIEHVDPALGRKFASAVTNAMHSRPEGSGDISAHVDHDTERDQLRIVIHGGPTETANLLGLIAIWSAQLSP